MTREVRARVAATSVLILVFSCAVSAPARGDDPVRLPVPLCPFGPPRGLSELLPGVAEKSLRRFKEDVHEVSSGYECGIGLERFADIKRGDIIEPFVRERVAKKLAAQS